MEWFIKDKPHKRVKAVLFDFDGTLSTLRCGWEEVMEQFMIQMIEGSGPADNEVRDMVRAYISESTGIQTIFQMKWLAEKVLEYGGNLAAAGDPWVYKEEYNRRLMTEVEGRLRSLEYGSCVREDFIIAGGLALIEKLCNNGIKLYVASGTDDKDVKREIAALKLSQLFTAINGAPERREDCPKEAVIRSIIENSGTKGYELAVVGDGKVEITVGKKHGARTLGVASDEKHLTGVDEVKRARLTAAGADAITGDFTDIEGLHTFFFGSLREI